MHTLLLLSHSRLVTYTKNTHTQMHTLLLLSHYRLVTCTRMPHS